MTPTQNVEFVFEKGALAELMQHRVDWLLARNGIVFGSIWLGASEVDIARVFFEARRPTRVVRLRTARAAYHTAEAGSGHSDLTTGFLVYGRLDNSGKVKPPQLCVELSNGTVTRIPISLTDLSRYPSFRFRSLRERARRASALIRSLRFHELRTKLRASLRRQAPNRGEGAVPFLVHVCRQTEQAGALLVVDHSLGGGANVYRAAIVHERISLGQVVVVVSFDLPTLQYVLEVCSQLGSPKRFAVPSLAELTAMAELSLFREVLYNNAVSFPDPEGVPDILTRLASDFQLPVTIAIHDFLAACPSQFLLNKTGTYCDLPDVGVCRSCLPANEFVLFEPARQVDISQWRTRWGNALRSASTILCFSNASARLLQRVFPDLNRAKIHVRAHGIDGFARKNPRIEIRRPLHIGVVGNISFQKGAQVVRSLSEEIQAGKLDVRITVIGTLEGSLDTATVSVTGAYDRANLPEIIERSGVNLMLFPSVSPETFSFVVAELMEMQLPIASFDFGGPAERVATYPLGKLLRLCSATEMMRQLVEFHEELKLRKGAEAQRGRPAHLSHGPG